MKQADRETEETKCGGRGEPHKQEEASDVSDLQPVRGTRCKTHLEAPVLLPARVGGLVASLLSLCPTRE